MESNAARLIRTYYKRLWNEWAFDLIDELLSPTITIRGSLGMDVRGRAGFRAYMEAVRYAFPDFHNDVDDLLVDGDRVVARLTYSGTHRGELFGVAATGQRVRYAGVAMFRTRGDVIADGWVLADAVSLRRQ